MALNIIIVFIAVFLFSPIKCAENDAVQIVVAKCDNCNASSYSFLTIGPNQTFDVVGMAVPRSSHFFVIQVHNPMDAIRLSYDPDPISRNSVYGTNVGLNQLTDDNLVHTFYLFSNVTVDRRVLIAITSYSKEAPMPGGCNMEFNTETAPYQKIAYDDAMITVDVQSASIDRVSCDVQTNITLDFYQLFVDPGIETVNGSFDAIVQMLTVDSIKTNGHMVIKPWNNPTLRRFFNNYRGYGVIYAVIASRGNASAAYVPAITYGCDMRKGVSSCFDNGKYTLWNVMKVYWILSLVAPFHPFVKFVPLFNIAYYGLDAVITYAGYDFVQYLYIAPFIAGLIALSLAGALWHFKLNKVILRLYAAHLLVALIFTMTASGDFVACQTPAYFWILYLSILLLMMIPSCEIFQILTVIGLHLIVAIDILVGNSALVYININAVRIASITNFHLAALYSPPTSGFANVCILAVPIFAILIKRMCKHRLDGERTPLLAN